MQTIQKVRAYESSKWIDLLLDFVHESSRLDAQANRSLYGGNRVASEITGGVDLVGLTNAGAAETGGRSGPGGFYNFGNGIISIRVSW